MPIYEYECRSCGKRSSLFFRSFSATTEPTCSHCGSGDLERLISRVAVLRSSQDLFNDYDRGSWMGDLPGDEEAEGLGGEDGFDGGGFDDEGDF